MAKLEGKVAIVTGATSGIGRATAILMAREGAKTVLVGRDETRGTQVEAEISRNGGEATFFRTDVSRPEEVEAMVRTAVGKYGRLDVMFNNAGITKQWVYTADFSLEDWQEVIDINLTGVFLGMKYAIPEMLKTGGGSIINTSSTSGVVVLPGTSAYGAAKAGVIMLTKTAAVEYGSQGIRVNAILPGAILTPMIERGIQAAGAPDTMDELGKRFPIGRIGKAEEVAKLVLFLASDDSSYCTAGTFLVDGGFTAV